MYNVELNNRYSYLDEIIKQINDDIIYWTSNGFSRNEINHIIDMDFNGIIYDKDNFIPLRKSVESGELSFNDVKSIIYNWTSYMILNNKF